MAQFNQLTKREWEVVKLLLQGKSNKLIASSLGISTRTVEFHLKNIYAKYQVSSRIELVLKLGNTTGKVETEKLGVSTVDRMGKTAENRSERSSQMNWAAFFRETVSMIGKESEMKNLLNTKHVPVGVIAAFFAGFVWLAMLIYSGDMPTVREVSVPMIVILPMMGIVIGIVGKQNGSTLQKVFFSTLLSVALSPFGIIPLMMAVVIPLGRLAAQVGIINPSTMPGGLATLWATIIMTGIWLVAGITIGTTLLFMMTKRSQRMNGQIQASEHGL
ncbi:MAG: helix-turn-helix transcriptional regulator [Chloroflexi bacterium]|nr:helix-turn-helix transcriptional regulator [Chloroflexota bacterium]